MWLRSWNKPLPRIPRTANHRTEYRANFANSIVNHAQLSYFRVMPRLKQRPELIETPEALRAWRKSFDASRATVAEVLGVGERTYQGWEMGEHAIPPTAGWALIAAEPHVRSLARHRARMRSTRARRAANARHARARKKQREERRRQQREAMQRFREQVDEQLQQREHAQGG